MPEEDFPEGSVAMFTYSFTINKDLSVEKGESPVALKKVESVLVREQPLLKCTFVKGVGLVIPAAGGGLAGFDGRIEFEGRVYRVERVVPIPVEPEQFISITHTEEGYEAETKKYLFHEKAKVYIEDVEDRTVDKMTVYVADALRNGHNVTIQNWEQVVKKETQRLERPLTAGSRYDREVIDEP